MLLNLIKKHLGLHSNSIELQFDLLYKYYQINQ